MTHLTRRNVLRGAGAMLALPWMESICPLGLAKAADRLPKPPVRSAFLFFPNGVLPENWCPSGDAERGWGISPMLKPLDALRDDILLLENLWHRETVGRNGVTLTEYWAEGMRTRHGINVHGFPNAFWVQPTQGANLISNVPHNIVESGMTIAMMVKHALDGGYQMVEVSREAEDAWLELLKTSAGRMIGSPDCTPGYYNNEGQGMPEAAKLNVGYPAGATAYFKYIREWREQGDFEGMQFN